MAAGVAPPVAAIADPAIGVVLTTDARSAPRYTWTLDWSEVPARREVWPHQDLAVCASGLLIVFDALAPLLHLVDPDSGQVVAAVPSEITEPHGITPVLEQGVEYLWIADLGAKAVPQGGMWGLAPTAPTSRVVKMSMNGFVEGELDPPRPALSEGMPYVPTAVAVDEARLGGSGDVWVADGYGQGGVHRFDAGGGYLQTVTGNERGGERFNCPHALFINRRPAEPELYVADRGNSQVQVFDMDGNFKRTFGRSYLSSPSAFAEYSNLLVIAELFGRLTLCDENDDLVCYLGEQPGVHQLPGWPNTIAKSGVESPADRLRAPLFNSPHGLAITDDGKIFVSEWVIPGRHVRLVPAEGH